MNFIAESLLLGTLSFAVGVSMGSYIRNQLEDAPHEINHEIMSFGFLTASNREELFFTEEVAKELVDIFFNNEGNVHEYTEESAEEKDEEHISDFSVEHQQVKEILKSNFFVTATSLVSTIIFYFDNENYTFRLMALDGTELSRAIGTYHISNPTDGSIAKIILFRDGEIRKSSLYEDYDGISTEIFLINNDELLLKTATAQLYSSIDEFNKLTMDGTKPEYYLTGKDIFYSKKMISEDESIAKEAKRRELEEKLKGL